MTLLALLAIFLQSFAVQTHIHNAALLHQSGAVQAANTPAPSPLKLQDPLDQGGCRLCQEFAHSGLFVGPAIASLSAGLVFIMAVFIIEPLACVRAAHPLAWQSRAPPQR